MYVHTIFRITFGISWYLIKEDCRIVYIVSTFDKHTHRVSIHRHGMIEQDYAEVCHNSWLITSLYVCHHIDLQKLLYTWLVVSF